MSFEEYWETSGSRQDVSDHKERARLAWGAASKGYKEIYDLIAPAKLPDHSGEMAAVMQKVDDICEENLEEK